MMTELCQLANKYGTDKGPRGHNYTPTYHEIFNGMRDIPVKLLEIGVKEGASLKMWSDYFPKGCIVGLDIDPKIQGSSRFAVEVGDQTDIGVLSHLRKEYGPFDIIIDDGSHNSPDQKLSLLYLYPNLKSLGWYCIEDVHTSYMGRYKGGYLRHDSFIEHAKRMIDSLHQPYTGEVWVTSLDHAIRRIIFETKLVMVQSK